jgi:hypothetical protein
VAGNPSDEFLAYDSRPDRLTVATEAGLVPPAFVLVVGAMLFWAFKGFSSKA